MARKARREVFSPDEVATVHVSSRCVRGLYLMGYDEFTREDHSERRGWFVAYMKFCLIYFAIDLLEHAIMENHFHMLLRSRPDAARCWNNIEVARRWLLLCPEKDKKGKVKEPTKAQIRSLAKNEELIKELRRRLSDISWFVRKICQHIAQRANAQSKAAGKPTGSFWNSRFNAVRLLDEEAVLACSAYINLNPIRAMMAHTFEGSDYTSIQQRLADLLVGVQAAQLDTPSEQYSAVAEPIVVDSTLDDSLPSDSLNPPLEVNLHLSQAAVPATHAIIPPKPPAEVVEPPASTRKLADVLTERFDQLQSEMAQVAAQPEEFEAEEADTPEMAEHRRLPREPWRPGGYLAPLEVNEAQDPVGPRLSRSPQRCSDRGYLAMPIGKYIEILEWCARQIRPDKRGSMPEETPHIIQRLGIPEETWIKLVTSFSEMFSIVAGMPQSIDAHRSSVRQRYYMLPTTRELLTIRPLPLESQDERHAASALSPSSAV